MKYAEIIVLLPLMNQMKVLNINLIIQIFKDKMAYKKNLLPSVTMTAQCALQWPSYINILNISSTQQLSEQVLIHVYFQCVQFNISLKETILRCERKNNTLKCKEVHKLICVLKCNKSFHAYIFYLLYLVSSLLSGT